MKSADTVKNYYESNTKKFLQFGRDAATKSIHQPLWKEANFTYSQALYYANELILQVIKASPKEAALNIVDLGCGVGSSLFYLAKKLPQTTAYYGVSISATQIDIAKKETAKRAEQGEKIQQFHFLEADFSNLPTTLPQFDVAFSIEAFAHAPIAKDYFQQVAKSLKKGGKLILIDDFLNDEIDFDNLNPKAQKAIADFKYGWMVESLLTHQTLSEIAASFNLKVIEQEDLTLYMHNNTLKHKWIRLLVNSFRWVYDLAPRKSAYFRSWIGGKGKQYCLAKGIVKYQKVVFEKV